MKKLRKILKSKHHEVIAWATCYNGTGYVAAVARNEAEFKSDRFDGEIEEALNDPSVEQIELLAMRKINDGNVNRVAVGKPLAVIS